MEQKEELSSNVKARIDSISRSGHLQDAYNRIINGLLYAYSMGVAGDIAEFGTWTGRSSMVIAETVALLNKKLGGHLGTGKRRVFYFDSFQGLPEITAEEDFKSAHVEHGVWKKGRMTFLGAEGLRKAVNSYIDESDFEIVPGFFKDTLSNVAGKVKFGFIHCDVDLYSSTIDALAPLFEHKAINPGCIILFDDWNCSKADPSAGQRKAWSDLCKQFNIQFSDEGAYSYHGRAVIVHEYE
ncbi:MAG TPA: TylF/MycF/NovP-related O-methyltransferase [Rickettsiales bacterium]|nr:TylF/MycF/NovP-related O-methyltransferase [Rickettsiales bacterium]